MDNQASVYQNYKKWGKDSLPSLSVVLFDDAVDASCFGIA
jgi:hypothetical protein